MLPTSLALSTVTLSPVELHAGLGTGVHELWSQRPVVAFARRVVLVSGNFHEALVQREIVSDGVLPASSVLSVEREVLHYVTVDLVQCQLLALGALDCHGDERDVGVWRPLVHLQQSLVVADYSCQQRERHCAGVIDGV